MTTVPDQLELDAGPGRPRRSRPAIVHVVTRYLRGGSERRVRDIATALPEVEHHLVLGGGSDADLAARDLAPASLTVLPSLIRQPHPWHDAVTLRRLARLFRGNGFDAVVTHQSKAGVLGRMAARAAGVPVVHSLSMASFGEGYPRWQSALFRAIEARLARSTAAYVVVGADLRRRYEAIGVPPDRLHVVRSGVPLPAPDAQAPATDRVRRELGLPADRPLILSLGSLEPRKNVLELPVLLGHLLSRRAAPRPFLAVAGEGPLEDRLRDAFGAAGQEGDAALLGFLPDPLPLIATADVLVLLSSAEGVPQVLVQAAAVGTPFVAFAVDGVRELIELGAEGVGVPAGDLVAAGAAAGAFLERDRASAAASIDLSPWSARAIAEGYRGAIGAVLEPEPAAAPALDVAHVYEG